MRRRLAELDRLDLTETAVVPRSYDDGRHHARPTRQRNPVIVVVLLGFGAVGALALGAEHIPLPVLHVIQRAGEQPPIPLDASRRPLGSPPPAPTGEGGYRFMAHLPGQPDAPIAYDPCRPIHIVVNDSLAPPEADRLLHDSIREVSEATGLVFTVDGSTDELPRKDRPPRDEQYGDRWSPVLVAWTTPAQLPALAGPVAGVGGSQQIKGNTSSPRYVTGVVGLDSPAIRRILKEPGGYRQSRAIVMHELGHLVGLAHVPDPHQLMYRSANRQADFNDGDLRGLRRLGLGQCHFDT